MNWAFKRQLIAFGILLSIVLLMLTIIFLPRLTQKPSCTDGKENGTETGIDCGGACSRICVEELRPLRVLFSRAYEVSPTVYNAVAYVENPNTNAGLEKVGYTIKLYNDENVLVKQVDGTTYIGPNGRYPVFVPAIDAGNRIPRRTTFTFTDAYSEWKVLTPEFQSAVVVKTEGETLDESGAFPRVRATLINDSLYTLSAIDVIAFVFDAEDIVIATSKTQVLNSEPGTRTPLVFTWPKAFDGKAVRVELIPVVNLFTAVSL